MAALAGIALVVALVALVVVAFRYRAERRAGARVRVLFERYVAPPVVDELLGRADTRLYTGRPIRATIVVCRIWNFAGFAETLSAEETLRYLNEFYALAGSSIQKYGGIVEKFLGDGIVGAFGVPLADSEAEEHAVRAALDIVRLIDAMNTRWQAQGRRSFHVGIGINSGDVIAGDAGFHERREYTVVGPEALFAARLQEATLDLRASIVAAATTMAPVRHLFSLIPLTGHPLPGLKRLADGYIVLGLLRESDALAMPAPSAFRETQIESPAPGPAPRAVRRATPPPPEIAPVAPIERPDPLTPLHARRRQAELAADTAFALPELQPSARFEGGNGPPIYPDPPPPRTRYEDGGGPPIQLPS